MANDLEDIFDKMADNDLAVASAAELAEEEIEDDAIEADSEGKEPAIEADAPVTKEPVAAAPAVKPVAEAIGIPGITDAKDETGTEIDDDGGEAAALKNPHSPEAKAFQKARKRAQKAEQEAAELRKQLEALKSSEQTTSTEAVDSGNTVDIDDDDYVQGSQVKTLITSVEQRIEAKIRAELAAKEADRRVKDFEQRAITSAEQFSKEHPDYAVRMKLAKTIMPFNEDERKLILASPNPAETAYNIIGEKQALFQSAIGITVPVNNTSPAVNAPSAQTKTNNNDGFEDDNAALRAFMGG